MILAPLPEREAERLVALRALAVLDSPPEERFDRVTRLAKRVFDVPVAVVSLVDEDRQWFKSRVGMQATQTPRDISLCSHAILQGDVMVVSDTTLDERFHDNPMVVEEPHVRFYAGCPLEIEDGLRVGTLCILDFKQRECSEDDRALLRDLAHMVAQDLSSARAATEDALTGLMNRRGFERLAPRVLAACAHADHPLGLLYFDLNGFKAINDEHGHAEGDRALRTFAQALSQALREDDVAARLGGDEFVVLLPSTRQAQVDALLERIAQRLQDAARRAELPYDIRASAGFAQYNPARHDSVQALISAADHAMYALKAPGPR